MTTTGVCAALDAAAKFAKVFYDRTRQNTLTKAAEETKEAMIKYLYDPLQQRFIKGILPNGEKDLTIDSSVTTIFAYSVFDPADFRVKNTMESLERNLWVKTDVGGFSRYNNDQYRRVSQETRETHGLLLRFG